MSDFLAFNATTNPIIRLERDWNNLLAHGLEKAPHFICRVNGSYYEAVNGSSGLISYGGASNAGATSGTDQDAVIQAAFDNLPGGGSRAHKEKVLIKGVWDEIGSPLTPSDYTHIELYGKLTLSDNVDDNLVTMDGVDSITIRGGYWDGNADNQAGGRVISVKGASHHIKLEDMAITGGYFQGIRVEGGSNLVWINQPEVTDCGEDTQAYGIYLDGQATPVHSIWVSNAYVHDNGNSGITAHDASKIWVTNANCVNNYDVGIAAGDGIDFARVTDFFISNPRCKLNDVGVGIYGSCRDGRIVGGSLHENLEFGITIQEHLGAYPQLIQVEGVSAYLNGTIDVYSAGIRVADGNDIQIMNCLAYNNGLDNTYPPNSDGINIDGATATYGRRCIVMGCKAFDNRGTQFQRYGIRYTNNAQDNICIGNDVWGNVTAQIVLVGTGNQVGRNRGFATENTGTGTIASGGPPATSGNVAHGLDVTPDEADFSINLTENPTNTPGAVWVDSVGAVNFVVMCENDPGASNLDFSWHVVVY